MTERFFVYTGPASNLWAWICSLFGSSAGWQLHNTRLYKWVSASKCMLSHAMPTAGRFPCYCSLRLTWLGVVLVSFALWFGTVYWKRINLSQIQLRPSLVRQSAPNFSAETEMDSLIATGRVVDTPSCVIPDFDPFNSIISQTLWGRSVDFVSCNTSWPMLTDITDGQFIQINGTLKVQLVISYCEYQEVCVDNLCITVFVQQM